MRWFEGVEPRAMCGGRARVARGTVGTRLALHWLSFGGQRLTVLEGEGPSELKYTFSDEKQHSCSGSLADLRGRLVVPGVDLGSIRGD